MTDLNELFRTLSHVLDETVRAVDADLPAAEDIHPAIAKIGAYAADKVRLPEALAKLEVQRLSAGASVPAREAAVRRAKHAVVTLETKLKKLGESLARNRAVLTEDDVAAHEAAKASGVPSEFPTRVDIIAGLEADVTAAERELADARVALKRMEALRKGVATRIANLAMEVAASKKVLADHGAGLEEAVKLLRKTIAHLKNRQEKRDRKRAVRTTAPAAPTEVEAPKAPTDEDILKMAEAHGLPVTGPADLEAARELFLN